MAEVTVEQISSGADNIKKWAIKRWLQDRYLQLDNENMNAQPIFTPGAAPNGQYSLPSPGEWAQVKASFDWIKPKFLGYTKIQARQFEPLKNDLAQAKAMITKGGNLPLEEPGKVIDQWGGNYSTISRVMSADLWKGNAAEEFTLNYVDPLPTQARNSATILDVLWHAVNANQAIIEKSFQELAGIQLGTLRMLGGNVASGESSQLPAGFWPVVGAVVGLSATIATAGLGAGAAVAISFSVASNGCTIANAVRGPVTEAKKKEAVEITGGNVEQILGSMSTKLSDMERAIDGEAHKIDVSLNKVVQLLDSGNGMKYISAKEPAVAKGAKGDLGGLYDPSGVEQ